MTPLEALTKAYKEAEYSASVGWWRDMPGPLRAALDSLAAAGQGLDVKPAIDAWIARGEGRGIDYDGGTWRAGNFTHDGLQPHPDFYGKAYDLAELAAWCEVTP